MTAETRLAKIEIRQLGDGWQASVSVVRYEHQKLHGVKGGQSPGGPWIGGFGVTPEDALESLKAAIGDMFLPILLESVEALT